jgi:hypothetical protein
LWPEKYAINGNPCREVRGRFTFNNLTDVRPVNVTKVDGRAGRHVIGAAHGQHKQQNGAQMGQGSHGFISGKETIEARGSITGTTSQNLLRSFYKARPGHTRE